MLRRRPTGEGSTLRAYAYWGRGQLEVGRAPQRVQCHVAQRVARGCQCLRGTVRAAGRQPGALSLAYPGCYCEARRVYMLCVHQGHAAARAVQAWHWQAAVPSRAPAGTFCTSPPPAASDERQQPVQAQGSGAAPYIHCFLVLSVRVRVCVCWVGGWM